MGHYDHYEFVFATVAGNAQAASSIDSHVYTDDTNYEISTRQHVPVKFRHRQEIFWTKDSTVCQAAISCWPVCKMSLILSGNWFFFFIFFLNSIRHLLPWLDVPLFHWRSNHFSLACCFWKNWKFHSENYPPCNKQPHFNLWRENEHLMS